MVQETGRGNKRYLPKFVTNSNSIDAYCCYKKDSDDRFTAGPPTLNAFFLSVVPSAIEYLKQTRNATK